MSDTTKTMNLTSLVSKKTRRAKARLLQNFGKADRTTDELFEVYQINFNRQQTTALNLQKHVKHYVHCLKELHEASKCLSQCLLDMHEKEWPKHDVYENNAYELDHINEDLEEKLKESVLAPLEQYLGQFAEIREKISKRGRKLVDYDSLRHTHETLQQNQADEAKISKSRDQLEAARRVYDSLNNDLHDELPALYDNRLPFIITVFQRLFSSKVTYHNDCAAIQKSYLDTIDHLARATEKGSLTSASSGLSATGNQQSAPTVGGKQIGQSNYSVPTNQESGRHQTPVSTAQPTTVSTNNNNGIPKDKSFPNETSTNNPAIDPKPPAVGANSMINSIANKTGGDHLAASGHEEPQSIVAGQPREPVLLHKVVATYRYMAEDEDELSFESGEVIQVIEYEDPSEQEDGWLMGIKESDGRKGLFPANFTKAI